MTFDHSDTILGEEQSLERTVTMGMQGSHLLACHLPVDTEESVRQKSYNCEKVNRNKWEGGSLHNGG